jgi:hypothetical protein
MDARTSRYHEVYARWQRDPQHTMLLRIPSDLALLDARHGC